MFARGKKSEQQLIFQSPNEAILDVATSYQLEILSIWAGSGVHLPALLQ